MGLSIVKGERLMKFKRKNPECLVEFDSEEIKSMKIVEENNQDEVI